MRILVLSEDRLLAERYRRAAEEIGTDRLATVKSVPEALERMFRLPFDALISDDRSVLCPYIRRRPVLWPDNVFLLLEKPPDRIRFPRELTYCFLTDSDPYTVLSFVSSFPNGQTRPNDTEQRISRFLQSVGVPVSLYGFQYLNEAIHLLISRDRIVDTGVMNELYEIVAHAWNVETSVVEHAMRHAIGTAWIRADMHMLETVFGYTVDAERAAPSNAAFVFRAADHLRIMSGEGHSI